MDDMDHIEALLALVEDETGADDPDLTDDESVGWKGGEPLPMTFGHIRRARAAVERLKAAR